MIEEERGETISIYLPASILRRLDEECRKERRSRSNYITIILEEHFKRLTEERPSRPLIKT